MSDTMTESSMSSKLIGNQLASSYSYLGNYFRWCGFFPNLRQPHITTVNLVQTYATVSMTAEFGFHKKVRHEIL